MEQDAGRGPSTPQDLHFKLSPRERQFLQAYIDNGMYATQAYKSVFPNVNEATSRANGYRMLSRIRRKAGGREGLLEMFGLGEVRLMKEVDARLKATKVEFYLGALVRNQDGTPMVLEDNSTRMAATKLLAELHGARRQSHVGPDGSGPVEFTLVRRVVVRPGEVKPDA